MSVRRAQEVVEVSSLGKIKLYREDLKAIAKVAAEVGDLSITCDALEATDADDFDELPEELHNVRITSSGVSRKVEVILNRKTAKVRLVEPDTHIVGVQSSIYRITDASRRRSLRLFRWYSIFLAVTGLAGLMAFSEVYKASSKFQLWQTLVFSAALSALLLGPVFAYNPRKWVKEKAVIVNAYRADRPTFLQRTKDDWIVDIVVGAFFLVLGLVIGLVAGSKIG